MGRAAQYSLGIAVTGLRPSGSLNSVLLFWRDLCSLIGFRRSDPCGDAETSASQVRGSSLSY